MARGEAITVDQFRELLRTIDWNAHLHAAENIRVDITGKVSWLKDRRFAGQLVMDAIRDQATLAKRPRPDYDTKNPAVHLAIRFGRGQVDIGINLNRAHSISVVTEPKGARHHYRKHLPKSCWHVED